MSLSNCKINFLGIEQDIETQTYIDRSIRALRLQVPTDSSLKLNVSDNKGVVNADLTVKSATVQFESSKKGLNTMSVVALALEDIQHQIGLWIEKRIL